MVTWADIKEEFDNSLGYIRGDIKAIRKGTETINYTVMLLVGCGCEMLAAAIGDKNRQGETVFAELLPDGDWRVLAKSIYTALRDGLAHGFDTKHLVVNGVQHQIQISWNCATTCKLIMTDKGLWLKIGLPSVVKALTDKIDALEKELQVDANEQARILFKRASEQERTKPLNRHEAEAWARLVKAAGY